MQEMQETQFQPLGWDDPPEKGMATHSNILAWRIPWTQQPGHATAYGSALGSWRLACANWMTALGLTGLVNVYTGSERSTIQTESS